MRAGVISLIFAVFAVGCVATSAEARGSRQSLDQILPQIREQHPGTFYDAEGPFDDGEGRAHYRVKWKTPEGRVIWFNADAHSGHVTGGANGRRNEDFLDRPRERDPDGDYERGRSRHNRYTDDDGPGDVFGDDGERPRDRRTDRPNRPDRGGWDRPDRSGWDRPTRGNWGDRGDRGNRQNGGPFGGDNPGRHRGHDR